MQPGVAHYTAAVLIAASSMSAAAATSAQPADIGQLAERCAPNVAARTMQDIVAVESHGRRLAINVNGDYRLPRQPSSDQEAVATIRWLEKHNYNFDVGYAQVNSANFVWLGVTGPGLLNGCNNIRAAATVLTGCYRRAVKNVGAGQAALKRALSCYNTGSLHAGFQNGYVTKVAAKARELRVPALGDSGGKPLNRTIISTKQATKSKRTTQTPHSEREGEPGAFGEPDPGAFSSANHSAFKQQKAKVSGKASDAGLPDSSETTQDDRSGRTDQQSSRSSTGQETMGSDIRDSRGRR